MWLADPPRVAPSGRRAYGWLHGRELDQRAIADDPVLAKTHMTAKRACVLAADGPNDACEGEMKQQQCRLREFALWNQIWTSFSPFFPPPCRDAGDGLA